MPPRPHRIAAALGLLLAALWGQGCGGASRNAEGPKAPDVGPTEKGLRIAAGESDPRAQERSARPPRQAPPAPGGRQDWEQGLRDLALRLGERLRWEAGEPMKLAVLDFATPDGRNCELSAPVAEELTTRLFDNERVSIIERRMLHRVLSEKKVSQSDFFDPDQVTRLGRLIGADGVVTGTITAAEGHYTLNARIIVAESAEVASVARVNLSRRQAEQRGVCREIPQPPPPR